MVARDYLRVPPWHVSRRLQATQDRKLLEITGLGQAKRRYEGYSNVRYI